ncbi:MAG TPA: PAS domain-containing protein [Alphaproteobacteria bacterium]|nr:PAS domain-containing protein [Alphaproteobacteria bacterium]
MSATVGKKASRGIGTFPSGGGKAGALMRMHDWSGSPLGPPEGWPAPLRVVVELLLNSLFPMFVAWGPGLGLLYNDAYAEILGAKHPAALGARFRDVWSEIWPDVSPLITSAMAGEATFREDLPLIMNRHGYDERAWFTFSYSPVRGESGAVEGMFCAVAETTQQARARRRQAFRLSLEHRLRDLADPIAVMAAATEALGQELGASRVGYGEIDAAQENVSVGRNWVADGTPDFEGNYRLDAFDDAIMAEVLAGRVLIMEDVANDPRAARARPTFDQFGTKAIVVVPLIKEGRFTAALYVHDDRPRRWTEDVDLIAEVADRTWAAVERARAQSARRTSEDRLRQLNESLERQVSLALAERKLLADVVEDTDLLIHVVDPNYRWLAINRAAADEFARVFGVGRPKAGDNMLELLAERPVQREGVKSRWSRALAGEEYVDVTHVEEVGGRKRSYEMRFRSLRDENGGVIGAYQFVQDVAERLSEQARLSEAEAALMQLQKMEAVGRLTGGIAHDFNNLLGAIVGSLDLIRRKPEDLARVKRFADAGLEAAERGAKLTGQLLAFSRSQRIELKPVLVVELVSGMRELLARTLGPLIRLHFMLDDPRAPVLSDPTQLEMAVLNLAINSRDAMPEGGDLTIATAVRQIARDVDLPAGDYVELSVTDSGSGMPAEVQAKAFDPFFTTKGIGEGTGLGLSQVYGIARQAGGTARIESEEGKGTVVRLYLPLLTLQPAAAAEPERPAAAKAAARAATILLIDDDPDIRGVLAASLETLGYAVIAAENGAAGLEALEQRIPDLVVVDFAMPGMNGAEFATAARNRKPGLPIVFASGYAETAAIEKAAGPHAVVLRKPFRIDELETVVAAALSEKAGG